MRILGLSAYYHDSAAALLIDGQVFAAAQEERFTRIKHDPRFPEQAIRFCLNQANVSLSDLDAVVFYEKPFVKFERLIETFLSIAPRGFDQFRLAMPVWLREKLFQRDLLTKALRQIDPGFVESKLLFSEHHISHAASAFYPSPFSDAVVLTMDGVGEWATTSVALGNGSELTTLKEIKFPHSLGLLYSAFTYYTGFKVNSGEYKLMGLAPYGKPIYFSSILDNLIDLKSDGSFRLDQAYFDYVGGLKMVNSKFENLFGHPSRSAESELTQFHMDIAASIQAVTDEIVVRLARGLATETGQKNICLAGGVALNCVANGKLLRDGCFENVWIQPAAGDAGGAVGAALAAYHQHFKQARPKPNTADGMQGSYLGPSFSDTDICERLSQSGAKFEYFEDSKLFSFVASALASEKAVGWFQGRMEFGPRALGNRSILGDPRSASMQRTLNLKVKYRESFRPFAPAVRSEDVSEWFEHKGPSPYMLFVADVQPGHRRSMTTEQQALFGIDKLNVVRSTIPAVTHIDYSARLQTVHKETNPQFHKLLSCFKELTGCPVLVNTSFNVRGEPIVCTPEDAFRCFMGSEIDLLVIGNYILTKSDQDMSLAKDYKNAFAAD
jgi:carbamoyltransferase